MLRRTGLVISILFVASAVWACTPAPGPDAFFKRGLKAYNQGHYEDALRDFRYIADNGHGNAQLYLGKMYFNGEGVPQDSYQANRWFFMAAENGVAEAQYTVALMYIYGSGVDQDLSEAVIRLTDSANSNYTPAQYKLANIYSEKDSPAYNPVASYMWYSIFISQSGGSTKTEAETLRASVGHSMSTEDIATATRLAKIWRPIPTR